MPSYDASRIKGVEASSGERLRHGNAAYFLALACAAAFVAFIILFSFVGYTDSDDGMYAQAARGWVEGFPYLPMSHWGLRHVLVLPMAALFWAFGENEATLVAPMVLAFLALLATSFVFVTRVAGRNAGLVAAVLIASVPMFALNATTVTTDIAEALLILSSIWLFHFAWDGMRRDLFVASGVLAALACITRETSVALVLFYGLLFLMNYGGSRMAYVWMGVGFAVVLGLDTALLAWASGDPIHRLSVSLKGVAGDNPAMAGQFETQPGVDRFGNLAAPRWLSAFLVLFVNQSVGAICWVAVPVGIALALRRGDSPQGRIVRLLVGAAVVWFVITSFLLWFLWILPRYQSVTVVAFILPLSMLLGRLLDRGRWAIPALVIAGVVAVELLIISVTNRDPLRAERSLVAYVRQHPGPVRTDPVTLRGARWFLEQDGLAGHVTAAAPEPGSTFFLNSAPRRALPKDWVMPAPRPEWVEVASFERPPVPAAAIVERLGLERFVPALVMRKLRPPPQTARVYRLPE